MTSEGRKSSRVSLHHHSMSAHQRAISPPPIPVIRLERQRNLTMKRGMTGNVEPLGRASLRSKTSSSNSSEDKAKVCKSCCRKLVEFLFTQVGVGALVVCYTIVGAFIFRIVETQTIDPNPALVHRTRQSTIDKLWNLTDHYNTLNKAMWSKDIGKTLLEHQDSMVVLIKSGYDQKTNEERWTFPAALMFTLSVITMIGYGHMVPRTEWGKIGVMIYACFGIPVYILYFMNMGKVLSKMLKWIYTKAYRWNVRRKWKMSMIHYDAMPDQEHVLDEAYLDALEQKVLVPPTTCLWVMSVYLLIGTILFAEWEDWNYLDSVYFCVTSLLKIGLGDLVPGVHVGSELDSAETLDELKLVINFVYILLGMGIVAMCYYLLKEDVNAKVEQLGHKVNEKCSKCRTRIGL